MKMGTVRNVEIKMRLNREQTKAELEKMFAAMLIDLVVEYAPQEELADGDEFGFYIDSGERIYIGWDEDFFYHVAMDKSSAVPIYAGYSLLSVASTVAKTIIEIRLDIWCDLQTAKEREEEEIDT